MREKILRTVTYTIISIASLLLGTHLTWRWYWSPERIKEAKIRTWKERVEEFTGKQIQPPNTHLGTFVFNVNSHETR